MKAAFHTLGCKVNSYETQAVLEQFQNAGFDIVEFSEIADVYVVNTCSVTREAARKSRQIMHRCRKNNPEAIVAVTGCFVQEEAEGLLSDSAVDIIVGNSEKTHIFELVTEMLSRRNYKDKAVTCNHNFTCMKEMENGKLSKVRDLLHCRDYEEQKVTSQEEHVRAYIKIQDGCDRFCSYCIIPFLRGRSRSRNYDDILNEARMLADNGYKEIVLTGIDISSFSISDEVSEALAMLIRDIAGICGIERIRLGSMEEGIASEELIKTLSKIPEFCPQFHLSLQSGSDSVLKRMNRHYTANQYLETVGLIKKYFENPAITTDIIVGFPGESEEEFEETLKFAEKAGFSRIHVFPYSRRPGTKADRMPGQLTKAEKEVRVSKLMELAEKLQYSYEKSIIGKKQKVLIENTVQFGGKSYFEGYTPEYVRILAANNQLKINDIADITPTGFYQGILISDD